MRVSAKYRACPGMTIALLPIHENICTDFDRFVRGVRR
jgi:hypothetical protein